LNIVVKSIVLPIKPDGPGTEYTVADIEGGQPCKAKAMIVIEGLKGKPVAEICTEHQISQSGIVKLTAGRKNIFHPGGISSDSEMLMSHFG
jgi:hypothetical protein